MECGATGTQTRTFNVTKEPNKYGRPCPSNETRVCQGDPCPAVDCEVEWSEWGACLDTSGKEVTCGPAKRTRTYTVTRKAEHGGRACPATPETESCKLDPCPVDCKYEWGNYGPCKIGDRNAKLWQVGVRTPDLLQSQSAQQDGACPTLDDAADGATTCEVNEGHQEGVVNTALTTDSNEPWIYDSRTMREHL